MSGTSEFYFAMAVSRAVRFVSGLICADSLFILQSRQFKYNPVSGMIQAVFYEIIRGRIQIEYGQKNDPPERTGPGQKTGQIRIPVRKGLQIFCTGRRNRQGHGCTGTQGTGSCQPGACFQGDLVQGIPEGFLPDCLFFKAGVTGPGSAGHF